MISRVLSLNYSCLCTKGSLKEKTSCYRLFTSLSFSPFIREPVRKECWRNGEDFKKEGKIYRLRTQDDGEDENNTWNGNSTVRCSVTSTICANHCFSYDLIQLKFCWRSGTALCVPTHLQSVSLFLLSGLKLFGTRIRDQIKWV